MPGSTGRPTAVMPSTIDCSRSAPPFQGLRSSLFGPAPGSCRPRCASTVRVAVSLVHHGCVPRGRPRAPWPGRGMFIWLSMSAASLEMRSASSRTICLRSVRGLRSSPCATPRSPAAFSNAVAAKPVRLAACAIRLSFRREATAISRRSMVVRPIAGPVLAPLSGRTAHRRRETNEILAGCPRSSVPRLPPSTKSRVHLPYSTSGGALFRLCRPATRSPRAASRSTPPDTPNAANIGMAGNLGSALDPPPKRSIQVRLLAGAWKAPANRLIPSGLGSPRSTPGRAVNESQRGRVVVEICRRWINPPRSAGGGTIRRFAPSARRGLKPDYHCLTALHRLCY